MKRHLSIAALALAASAMAAEPPLVLITTTDTPPYSYRDEATGEIVGLEIDIARAAAAKLGRELEIRKAKFPELLPMVSAGKADMAASGITITEGRLQAVDFTVPYAVEGGMFLYRTGEPMPTMIRAERLRVATMDASTYDFYLSTHGIDPIRYDSYPRALADLKARRLDAVFFDSCAVKLLAEEDPELSASRLETRENFGIALGKGNTRLKAALDEAIAARRGQ
ncbi:MAG: amino acid ABC transporter substrate-binding protein [Kiritimatiellae bacterium]|nr:amino acid ABC transporter substrate-binding protein [Kiritimatiellia bacterium]MBR4523397.1 amino acid ABC transporter substrate-binding protein [Kiritimatiellia bacterium]